MSRLATSFVLGYHGCDKKTAVEIINGGLSLLHSEKAYDWLGPGAYFWESDPQRALEWAQWKAKRGEFKEAGVVGAVIDLRHCLDLVSREDLQLVKAAHDGFLAVQKASGLALPVNKNVKNDSNSDRKLRYLDCAVLKHLHSLIESVPVAERNIEPFDTVRGMFTEGGDLYEGSGFASQSHVQIAVRNDDCIKGLFHPRHGVGPSYSV